jgi:hypothetical protein
MKTSTAIPALFFIATLLFLAAAFAAEAPAGPITITNYGKKGKVAFKHSSHVKDTKCEDCHHNGGKGGNRCGTAKCHQSKSTGKAPSMKEAAHQKEKGKCWSCHFKQSPKASKPMKCKECHARKQ